MEPGPTDSRLTTVLNAIDAANAADPNRDPDGRPAALVYGERMSAELGRLAPDASGPLRIAARGQHVERWTLPRDAYPDGRAGYPRGARSRRAGTPPGSTASCSRPSTARRIATASRR
jgi:hypothetical protein